MKTWKLAPPADHFEQIAQAAVAEGPQRIEGAAEQAVVVVAESEWKRLNAPTSSFGRLLADCPLDDELLPPRRTARVLQDPAA